MTVARTLARQFRGDGYSSGVVSLGPSSELLMDPMVWADMNDVRYVTINRRGDLSSMLQVTEAVRSMKPRIVVCHSHRHAPALVAGMTARGRMPKIVVVEHHSSALRNRSHNVQSGLALACSNAVVLLSEAGQAGYPFLNSRLPGARRQAIIPNGVDTAIFPSVRCTRDTGTPPTLVIGMTSRLTPTKEHPVLIRAVGELKASGALRGIRLELAGTGPTHDSLVSLVLELGLEQEVNFRGHIDGQALVDYYSGLDVYAHATLGEGVSIALLEAAAARVPIVASDVAGVQDVFIDGETAVLVPPSDVSALANGIMRASRRDASVSISEAAWSMVDRKYSARRMMQGYLDLFSRIDPKGPWVSGTSTAK